MIQYARPSVDNLINNVPDVLKSSRQFVAWNPKAGGKKVPLDGDGHSWGNYKDPTCWRPFDDALDLLDSGRAFGIGLALPSPEQIRALPEFNLVSSLVAFDGDAKRCALAAPFNVPEHISGYVRSANSYSEFSPSLKGLRALIFGDLPISKQCLNKPFGDGTELSLYRTGWVTLSGLVCVGSSPTIEHRQKVIDHLIAELWPDQAAGKAALVQEPASASGCSAYFGDSLLFDWGRSASEDLIRQFIQGLNRTPKQLRDIVDTWELRRGWNHGDTPDGSMYTKRIVEEALWLRRKFGWTLQDVVDIVITFCKRNSLSWSSGRAKKQIADGERCILATTCQRPCGGGGAFGPFSSTQQHPPPTLTCNGSQIIGDQNPRVEPGLSTICINDLLIETKSKLRDTNNGLTTPSASPKVSRGFRRKSVARDAVLQAIKKYRGWVKFTTIAADSGTSLEAAKKQLQRLRSAGFVDGDGKGRYRKHRERQRRKLKPCSSKPFPNCRDTGRERKTLTRSELNKRGWPKRLIDEIFPVAGKDYVEKNCDLMAKIGRIVKTRVYRVSRVRAIELQPGFEIERAKILHRQGKQFNRGEQS